jgi:GT2 family glycosyltransferase/glycosyltransferase involved in cell wall biosynthesis
MTSEPTTPLLSVVVVTLNSRAMTLRCLKATAEATAGLATEVWLVDNGSLDGTPVAVARDFPSVKVIRNDRNLGFAAANNQALRQACGRYWLLLNTDTLLTPEALQVMVRYLDGNPRAAMVGPQLTDERGRPQNSVHSFPGLATELLNRSLLRILLPRRYPSKRTHFTRPTEVDALLGACLMVRAEAGKEVGLLDEEYFFYYEETDWCLRMKRAGWQVVFLPEVSVVHLSGGTVKGFVAARSIERHRSRYTFFLKHRSPGGQALLRAGVVARLCFALVGEAVLVALSLGRAEGASRRLSVAWSDLRWHLASCPADAGLRQATRPPKLDAVEAEMATLSQGVPPATLGEFERRGERLLTIALVIKDYAPQKGGGERYFDTLCRELLRRGHEVHAFVRSVEAEPPAGLVLHLVGGGGGFGPAPVRSFANAVEWELRPGRFDVTVALTQVWGADVYRAGGGLQRVWRRLQHPQRAVRLLADTLRPGRRLTGALEDHLFQRSLCQRIITNSALVRRQVLEEYRLLPEMVEVVYNGVDLARFAPLPPGEREAVRRGLGIGVDAPVVLFAANNFCRKGLATLLRALAAVRRVLPEVSLVVAGGGAEGPFRRLTGRLGVQGAVHFVGRRADIHRLYPASDIFVLPTLYDPCANVCLEALACGTPAITTLTNGAAEFIRPGETGYVLADASDHEGLARLLLHFFLRAERRRMGEEARLSMEAFTPEAHVDRLEAVLAKVARAAPPAPSFERLGELTVNREYAGLFRAHRLDRFEALAHIEPVVADREKRGRRLARFVLEDAAGEKMLFHLKAHRLRLGDLLRPLLSLAWPVTANAATEWWGMTELPRLGVGTATPVAFAVRRRWGVEWEGLTVSADLAGCTSLEEFLQTRIHPVGERSTGERAFLRELARELARIARSLHRRGVNHQDFYLGHFFVPAEQPLEGEPRLFLVDLQRLARRLTVPRRYLVKDLGQLLYSADRFPQLSRTDKLRFLRFCLGERPLSPGAKRLARAVIAKARRIADHSARVQARRA